MPCTDEQPVVLTQLVIIPIFYEGDDVGLIKDQPLFKFL